MILQSFDRQRLLHWGRLIGLWFCFSVRIRPSLSEEMADIVNDRWNVQYIFARGVKGHVEVELKANTDDFCTIHLIAYLLFASLVGFTTTKIKEIGKEKHLRDYATTKKIFLAQMREAIFDLAVKWRLILARIFLLDTFWVSALLIFSNEKKRGFCQPGLSDEIVYLPLVGSFACFLFPFSTGRKGS